MRRGFHYVNRYVMIKNRWEKNFFLAYYIWLPVSLALMFSSCAHRVRYDSIGTWERQPGTFTYVNHDQHIKVTLPNGEWQVQTRPPFRARAGWGTYWVRPTESEPGYTVMTAETRHMLMQILVEPTPNDLSLEGILGLFIRRAEPWDFWRGAPGAELVSSEIIGRGGRRMGVLEYSIRKQEVVEVPEGVQLGLPEMMLLQLMVTGRALIVVLKEKGRFVTLALTCTVIRCSEKQKDQFWAMIDSYEYIE